ncbi:hypothetical protein PTTG_25614 [Puccinia triticina 1-1 BBBD Race 1]|uniref:C2H2-type domain-containing protein n=1 Tax=Puccinia triticina (isolate 1-1 / race 1 (BBBD)) TaxID=630390 RepID=A0A180H2C0_PUCT1|nr:hypothetical protein PTTG_25614 [Puccinia triticina 1-1 BBBD Race 1]
MSQSSLPIAKAESPDMEVVMIKCLKDGCQDSFPSLNDVKKHQRITHQAQVSCTIFGTKDTVKLTRQSNDMSTCPTEGCNHQTKDPVNMQNHVKRCNHETVQAPRVMPVPPPDDATLVPIGNQVIVIPEYTSLAYNSYAQVLLCQKCNQGIIPNEVESHMARAHHEKG